MTRARLLLTGIMLISLLACAPTAKPGNNPTSTGPTLRILHVMSFHSPWKWTDDQFNGFRTAFEDSTVNYQLFQLDLKRHNEPEWPIEAVKQVTLIVEKWHPDLLYLSDDAAQHYVGTQYAGSKIPIVFSGVNRDAATYGYDKFSNVSGVLEREHFLESVALLQQVVPNTHRIAVVFDGDDENWSRLRRSMEAQSKTIPGVTFPRWINTRSYGEFQRIMTDELPSNVDAVCLVGIFGFLDEAGKNVPYQAVCRWIVEHSKLPDFSFWDDRVYHGTLLSVTIDGKSHGRAAGLIAHQILKDHLVPNQIPIQSDSKGGAYINSKRAKELGIQVSSSLLLNTSIVDSYQWDEHGTR